MPALMCFIDTLAFWDFYTHFNWYAGKFERPRWKKNPSRSAALAIVKAERAIRRLPEIANKSRSRSLGFPRESLSRPTNGISDTGREREHSARALITNSHCPPGRGVYQNHMPWRFSIKIARAEPKARNSRARARARDCVVVPAHHVCASFGCGARGYSHAARPRM